MPETGPESLTDDAEELARFRRARALLDKGPKATGDDWRAFAEDQLTLQIREMRADLRRAEDKLARLRSGEVPANAAALAEFMNSGRDPESR